MKQDKDWIDVMRSSLRDAESTPPAGGWERLERELGQVAPSQGPVWRNNWLRIAAVAAVLLCAVLGGELLLHEDRGVIPDGGVIVPVADGGGSTADQFLKPVAEDEELTARVAEVYRRHTAQPAGELVTQVVAAENVALQIEASDESTAQADGEEAVAAIVPETVAEVQNIPPQTTYSQSRAAETSGAESVYNPSFDDPFAPEKIRRSGKTSLGLFAGGGVSGGSESVMGPNRMFADMMLSPGEVVVSQKFSYNDFSYRHHLPLSFGVAARKEFTHGLSLETGVNYTLLLADVSSRNNSKEMTQKLHFIGIPLRANWQFLERGRFSLYIGAGGMLEKCISAKFGSQSVEEDALQWSVTGAAGAQYRLGGIVGLYFEPEVSYYFTQTELRTARTESPLSLSLRLGVRLSF